MSSLIVVWEVELEGGTNFWINKLILLIEKIARAWYGSIKSQTGGWGVGGRWVIVDGGGGGVSKSAWGMEVGHPPGPRAGPCITSSVLPPLVSL